MDHRITRWNNKIFNEKCSDVEHESESDSLEFMDPVSAKNPLMVYNLATNADAR